MHIVKKMDDIGQEIQRIGEKYDPYNAIEYSEQYPPCSLHEPSKKNSDKRYHNIKAHPRNIRENNMHLFACVSVIW